MADRGCTFEEPKKLSRTGLLNLRATIKLRNHLRVLPLQCVRSHGCYNHAYIRPWNVCIGAVAADFLSICYWVKVWSCSCEDYHYV